MPIIDVTGNLLDDDAEALVNAVNCVGVMGAGIALAFKQKFDAMFWEYNERCQSNRVMPGKVDVHILKKPRRVIIINFPTKDHFKDKSRLFWIEWGLDDLCKKIEDLGIKTIAIPALGCGRGGLLYGDVRPLLVSKLGDLHNVEVRLYGQEGERGAQQSGGRQAA